MRHPGAHGPARRRSLGPAHEHRGRPRQERARGRRLIMTLLQDPRAAACWTPPSWSSRPSSAGPPWPRAGKRTAGRTTTPASPSGSPAAGSRQHDLRRDRRVRPPRGRGPRRDPRPPRHDAPPHGLDHTRLTVRFDGRDMRLTDVRQQTGSWLTEGPRGGRPLGSPRGPSTPARSPGPSRARLGQIRANGAAPAYGPAPLSARRIPMNLKTKTLFLAVPMALAEPGGRGTRPHSPL